MLSYRLPLIATRLVLAEKNRGLFKKNFQNSIFHINNNNKPIILINRLQHQQLNNDKKNQIHTIPNYITLSRIISVPFINYFVFINQHELACGLFLLAGITDFIDGYIARKWPNQQSALGSILDPLADKLLIGSLTITLAVNNMLPIALAFIILARDIILILSSLILRYKLIDEPKTFMKYINVNKYSTVQIEADKISKFNTFNQLSLITLTLPSVLFDYNGSVLLTALQYLTGTTTLLSSISYLYKRGSYKVINK